MAGAAVAVAREADAFAGDVKLDGCPFTPVVGAEAVESDAEEGEDEGRLLRGIPQPTPPSIATCEALLLVLWLIPVWIGLGLRVRIEG